MSTRKAYEWTADKLDFIEKYIPAFVKATKRAKHRYYVDGFAGPGINKFSDGSTRPGSPLIALGQDDFTGLFLVEKKRSFFKALELRVKQHPNAEKASLYNADFNEVIPDILERIPDEAPTLFLLDPEGLELKWRSVELISQKSRADIFILISASGVLRNAPKPSAHKTLTEFYGGEEWRDVDRYKKPGFDYFHAYLDLYLEKLRRAGLRYADHYLIAKTSKKAKLHALVFAGKHDVGLKIANDILDKLADPARKKGMDPLF